MFKNLTRGLTTAELCVFVASLAAAVIGIVGVAGWAAGLAVGHVDTAGHISGGAFGLTIGLVAIGTAWALTYRKH